MTIEVYTEDFYRVNLQVGYVEDNQEKTARFLNGLWMEILDEINILSPRSVEEAYQSS